MNETMDTVRKQAPSPKRISGFHSKYSLNTMGATRQQVPAKKEKIEPTRLVSRMCCSVKVMKEAHIAEKPKP